MKVSEPSEDDLRERYKLMDDGELRDLVARGTLTELGQRVADQELKQRNQENHFRTHPHFEDNEQHPAKTKNLWLILLVLWVIYKVLRTVIENYVND